MQRSLKILFVLATLVPLVAGCHFFWASSGKDDSYHDSSGTKRHALAVLPVYRNARITKPASLRALGIENAERELETPYFAIIECIDGLVPAALWMKKLEATSSRGGLLVGTDGSLSLIDGGILPDCSLVGQRLLSFPLIAEAFAIEEREDASDRDSDLLILAQAVYLGLRQQYDGSDQPEFTPKLNRFLKATATFHYGSALTAQIPVANTSADDRYVPCANKAAKASTTAPPVAGRRWAERFFRCVPARGADKSWVFALGAKPEDFDSVVARLTRGVEQLHSEVYERPKGQRASADVWLWELLTTTENWAEKKAPQKLVHAFEAGLAPDREAALTAASFSPESADIPAGLGARVQITAPRTAVAH